MPKHLYVPLAEPFRLRVRSALQPLLENASWEGGPVTGYEQARQVLDSLPLTSEEFGVALNRLANAQRYLLSGERGAACYELRLLLRSLDR